MTALRSLVYFIGQSISIAVFLPVTLFSRLLPATTGLRLTSYWARFNTWSLRVICGLDYRVRGLENLPDEPCVLLSKHQSAWETIVFQVIFPPLSFVVKRELLWIPVFGWGLAASRVISINRGEARKALDAVLKQGADRLDRGLCICIFPEGTRMAAGEHGKFNPGGAMLACRTGAAVVPVAHNAGYYWQRNGFLKHSGTVEVVIGEAIDTEGRKARDVNAEAEQWIRETSARLAP